MKLPKIRKRDKDKGWWQKLHPFAKSMVILGGILISALFMVIFLVKMSGGPVEAGYFMIVIAIVAILIIVGANVYSLTIVANSSSDAYNKISYAFEAEEARQKLLGPHIVDLGNTGLVSLDKSHYGEQKDVLPETLSPEQLLELKQEMDDRRQEADRLAEEAIDQRYAKRLEESGIKIPEIQGTMAIANSAIQGSKSQQPIAPAKTAQPAKSNQSQQPVVPVKSAQQPAIPPTKPASATEPVESKPQQHPQPQQSNGQKPVAPTQAPVAESEQVKHPDNVVAVISLGENTGEIDVQRVRREAAKNDPKAVDRELTKEFQPESTSSSIEEQLAELGLGSDYNALLSILFQAGGCNHYKNLPPALRAQWNEAIANARKEHDRGETTAS